VSSIDDEIRSKTQAFASDLAVLVRRTALEAVAAALRGDTARVVAAPVQAVARRGRGRPRKVAPAPAAPATPAVLKPARVAPASTPAVSKKAAPKRAPGAKRPPDELAKLTEKLAEFIKANPGARMELIAKALGASAAELRFPARKLVTAKRIRTEGQKQSTTYFPA
jgi:hypothetical protein